MDCGGWGVRKAKSQSKEMFTKENIVKEYNKKCNEHKWKNSQYFQKQRKNSTVIYQNL